MWPICLMIVEKMIRSERAKHRMRVIEVKALAGDVMMIKFESTEHPFRYKAGQYLYLNCPSISKKEWHPFTISSSPEDNHISCHIRCRKDMDWCYALRKALNPKDKDVVSFPNGFSAPIKKKIKEKKNNQSRSAAVTPKGNNNFVPFCLRVDGPYGSAAEEVDDYDVVVLVGAGIGVTPFASIIRTLVLKSQQKKKTNSKVKKIDINFYWLCRNKEEFLSFRDLMKVKIADRSSVHFNLFMSGEQEVTDADFQRELNSYKKWSSLFTGRPNWKRIFGELRKKYKGKDVGVFACAAPPIVSALAKSCKKFSDDRPKKGYQDDISVDEVKTYFSFHQENF
jgi:NADPH oxidase 2